MAKKNPVHPNSGHRKKPSSQAPLVWSQPHDPAKKRKKPHRLSRQQEKPPQTPQAENNRKTGPENCPPLKSTKQSTRTKETILISLSYSTETLPTNRSPILRKQKKGPQQTQTQVARLITTEPKALASAKEVVQYYDRA